MDATMTTTQLLLTTTTTQVFVFQRGLRLSLRRREDLGAATIYAMSSDFRTLRKFAAKSLRLRARFVVRSNVGSRFYFGIFGNTTTF